MKYNKLVRDRIPEIIADKGGKAVTHIANEKEYWEKLKEKFGEEVKEFCAEPSIEEVADVLEVIDAICEYKKFEMSDIVKIKKEKAKKRGGFRKRIILEES